ncbi:MAG: hypothetical protein LBH34_02620 [Prevotellaceae bacterium]|jgi:hypothetical protein|nr:hypothetical protein [Prevotellaceae bacterium]
MKDEYVQFCNRVSGIFTGSQYDMWSEITHRSERYRFLSEDRQLLKYQVDQVFTIQKEYQDGKAALSNEKGNVNDRVEMMRQINESYINRLNLLLGASLSQEYLQKESLNASAVRFMKKMKVSYDAGYQIVLANEEFKARKSTVSKKSISKSDLALQMEENEERRDERLRRELSEDDFKKWIAFNDSSLEHNLRVGYGLNKEQIAQYKKLYNECAIAKYKVGSSSLTKEEKILKRRDIDEQFWVDAKAVFPAEAYEKWLVRRKYTSVENGKTTL